MRRKAVWVLAVLLVLCAVVFSACSGGGGSSNSGSQPKLSATVQVQGGSNQNK